MNKPATNTDKNNHTVKSMLLVSVNARLIVSFGIILGLWLVLGQLL